MGKLLSSGRREVRFHPAGGEREFCAAAYAPRTPPTSGSRMSQRCAKHAPERRQSPPPRPGERGATGDPINWGDGRRQSCHSRPIPPNRRRHPERAAALGDGNPPGICMLCSGDVPHDGVMDGNAQPWTASAPYVLRPAEGERDPADPHLTDVMQSWLACGPPPSFGRVSIALFTRHTGTLLRQTRSAAVFVAHGQSTCAITCSRTHSSWTITRW